MRKPIVYFFVVLCILAVASCKKHEKVFEPDPAFVNSSDIALVIDGKTELTYKEATWQSSFREKAIKYRVFSDSMTDYYSLVCDRKPESEGQSVTATLSYAKAGAEATELPDLAFTVVKLDSDTGLIKLWCGKKKIGVTVIQ